MKELWVQIEEAADEKEKLMRLASDLADAVLHGKTVLTSAKQEIAVLDEFNELAIRDLKREGESRGKSHH